MKPELKPLKRRSTIHSIDYKNHGCNGTARAFNQYAWLVGNTTGDYQRAVEYSRKSLELRNWESASYLDTLGHCYFGAKDYENAVKYQQQAVDMDPESLGMRRQLNVFRQALKINSNDKVRCQVFV